AKCGHLFAASEDLVKAAFQCGDGDQEVICRDDAKALECSCCSATFVPGEAFYLLPEDRERIFPSSSDKDLGAISSETAEVSTGTPILLFTVSVPESKDYIIGVLDGQIVNVGNRPFNRAQYSDLLI